MSNVRVELDAGICCGAGMCASIAPAAFKLESSGLASVLPDAAQTDVSVLIRAAKSCPTLCISIFVNDVEADLF